MAGLGVVIPEGTKRPRSVHDRSVSPPPPMHRGELDRFSSSSQNLGEVTEQATSSMSAPVYEDLHPEGNQEVYWEDEWIRGADPFEVQGIFPSDSPESQVLECDESRHAQQSMFEGCHDEGYFGSDGSYIDPLEVQGIFPSDSPSQVPRHQSTILQQ